jgi:N-acyl-D-aspartate/D-glutamate deacylase
MFDPTSVGPGDLHTRDDLPGGASRLFAGSVGVEHVLVNGVGVVTGGTLTGALPGATLRSGTDTVTIDPTAV